MVVKKANLQTEIKIPIGSKQLTGDLTLPPDAKGIALFAHGSGSSRMSLRNQLVARFLQDAQTATLLLDLLTPEEDSVDIHTREWRFNIPLLTERLLSVTDWISTFSETHHLTIGYFGASTGAAAALCAAAEMGARVQALVSRGGRPDLAGQAVARVQCPTLLIVGGNDHGVIEMNQHAFDLLQCQKKLEIIPDATHLFEEFGTLEEVGRMASLWFSQYL